MEGVVWDLGHDVLGVLREFWFFDRGFKDRAPRLGFLVSSEFEVAQLSNKSWESGCWDYWKIVFVTTNVSFKLVSQGSKNVLGCRSLPAFQSSEDSLGGVDTCGGRTGVL